MQWTQLCVHGTLSDRDTICAILCMLDENIVLEDYSDIDMKTVYADLIDEKILHADKNNITASIYVSEDKPLGEYISFLKDRFRIAHIDAQIACNGVKEEEWATAWRKYYHPTPIGNRLVIVPGWQTYTPKNTEITVQMDPGMAFGTGTHETTRLCGALLEQYVTPGDTQLDVGTGSGILAICGIKLGALYALACDIDPVAVRVAKENAEKNGVADQIDCVCADLLQGIAPPAGGFQICTANIVADVILSLTPAIGAFLAPNGIFISSGIIDTREAEVVSALKQHGYTILTVKRDRGWSAVCAQKTDNTPCGNAHSS